MSYHNAAHSVGPDDHQEPAVRVTYTHRVPHLPEGISLDVGALYQHALHIAMAALRLAEARLAGSAVVMQFAAQEISERSEDANACAKRIERQLARHRRRNPLAKI
jgi:hypothetical protein